MTCQRFPILTISGWATTDLRSLGWGLDRLEYSVLARDLPGFLPALEGDCQTTGSAVILREEKDVIAFAERPLQLSATLSVGVSRSFARGMGRAADEKV